MAEELQDASYRLPRVLLWATIINGGMMFVMAVTVTYCIGDLEFSKQKPFIPFINDSRSTLADGTSVLSTPTGYPYIQIFYNVTGSLAATNAMTALILILGFFGNVTVMAGSSRQLFAFARDEGMPFSKWIAKVRTLWHCGRTKRIDTCEYSPNKRLDRSIPPSTSPSTPS